MRNLDPKNLLKLNIREENHIKDVITIEIIKSLVKKHPNDMELGSKVRQVINSTKG